MTVNDSHRQFSLGIRVALPRQVHNIFMDSECEFVGSTNTQQDTHGANAHSPSAQKKKLLVVSLHWGVLQANQYFCAGSVQVQRCASREVWQGSPPSQQILLFSGHVDSVAVLCALQEAMLLCDAGSQHEDCAAL